MLRRLRVLEEAASARAPAKVTACSTCPDRLLQLPDSLPTHQWLPRRWYLTTTAVCVLAVQILPGLFVGSAVSADSHHVLRHLGITHIVNSTQASSPALPQAHAA